MEPFTIFKAVAAPLPIINVDTDMIIPKQFLKTIKRTGLGANLFDEMRFNKDGSEIKDFVLNQDTFRKAGILVAGDNFGCGSSREHAPWSLLDYGIKCVIAPSFADIFFNNCFKNGILPIKLEQSKVDQLMKAANGGEMKIDLPNQVITSTDGSEIAFDVEPFRKKCLLEGLDDIALTLEKLDYITEYENRAAERTPWIFA
ncbi:MAG: 3-isopropylmalate dehydratase small subunit [Rickettsiales bacterium]|nr:3-isopropylmalate dehydratase small subunit [Rickettsiales bacterium]